MTPTERPWILAGYELFAKNGPEGLKIEALARIVGKSKSSFYHHFSDLEIFITHLLDHHLSRAAIVIEEESQCKNVAPELLNVLLKYKEDLLFNRQLRVHRNVPKYRECFEKTNESSAEAIIDIWAEMLGVSGNSNLALMVLNLSLENFYLQLTEETLTYEWLEAYVKQLQEMGKAMNREGSTRIR